MVSATQALSQITEGMTVQDLRDLASTVDVTVGNSTLLLYSGGAGEIDAQTGQREYSAGILRKLYRRQAIPVTEIRSIQN